MARWPRLSVPGVPMHITQRGNNRIPTFVDALDFARYRSFLVHASAVEGCAIHAYALMTNHVHLLVTPSHRTGASRMMQILGRLYVRHFNARYHRSGTLWEGRFKSTLVESSAYFLRCSRYIDLNPLRAGLVHAPAEYEWSSFACLGLSRSDSLITLHAEYLALGHTAPQRARAYREMCGLASSARSCEEIRRATRGGSALGRDAFHSQMATVLRRPVTRMPHGGNRRRMETASVLNTQIRRPVVCGPTLLGL